MANDPIPFPGLTKAPIPVEKVLDGMKECEDVLIIGLDKEGELVAAASSGEDPFNLWLVELWKHNLLNGDYAQ